MKFKITDIARISNEDRFKQPILFDEMTFGNIYPTDIDAITEYHNWFFIFMEVKGEGVPLNRGQTTALMRLTDTICKADKSAVFFVCRHNVKDPTQPIFLKDTEVSEAYYCGQWHTLEPRTALEAWKHAMNWAKDKESNRY